MRLCFEPFITRSTAHNKNKKRAQPTCVSVRLLAVRATKVIHRYNLGGAIVALEAIVVEPMIWAATKPREAMVPWRGPKDGAQVVLCITRNYLSLCRHRRWQPIMFMILQALTKRKCSGWCGMKRQIRPRVK